MKKAYKSDAGSAKLYVNFPAPEDMSVLHQRDANLMAQKFFGNKYLDLGPDAQASTDRAYYVPAGFRSPAKFLVFIDVMSMYEPMSKHVQKLLQRGLAKLYRKSNLGPLPSVIKIKPARSRGRLASDDPELRKKLVKLAYDNPDFRPHIIPYLKG